MREMETDFHITLSPVTADPVGSDTDFPVAADPVTVDPVTADPVTVDPVVVDTECSLSPDANLSLFDNIFNSYLSKCFCCTQILAYNRWTHRSTCD